MAGREARIPLEACGPLEQFHRIEAIIDTGYSGSLTLSASVIADLDLPFAGYRRGMLADGSVTILDVYLGQVVWYGQRKEILVASSGGAALVGMQLLEGSRLTVDVIEGGRIGVERLTESKHVSSAAISVGVPSHELGSNDWPLN
jgi:clan AA aspartic protease